MQLAKGGIIIQLDQRVKAKKRFSHFLFWSAISFNLLSGNIIILYVLKFGAGNFLIGIISSFVHISLIMPLFGRKIVPRIGLVRLMAGSWGIRYLSMVPLLFVPLFPRANNNFFILGVCVISIFLFYLARGFGITSYNPIIGSLTTDSDRGTYFSSFALIFHSATIVVNIAIALLLGKEAPLFMYTAFIGGGVLTGLLSSFLLFRVPEPSGKSVFDTKSLFKTFISALGRRGFRCFLIPHLFAFFITAMINPFLIVFMKQVYHQTDSTIVYFLLFSSCGAIIMSLVSSFLLDRLGAKPLYFFYALIITLMLVITFITPAGIIINGSLTGSTPVLLWIYAGTIFFLFRLGAAGINNVGLIYLFSVITEQERLNLGVVYQMSIGIAATAGSILGGIYLESIEYFTGFATDNVFGIFFGSLIIISIIILILILRMESCGAFSIKDAVSVIFSPRDWKVISLLNRLKNSLSVKQERNVIKSLGKQPSRLSKKDLLEKLASPSFSIRAETLNALSDFPMSKEIEDALINEVKNHHFTTAFLAAKIIGKRKIQRAIPVLRKALHSADFFLCGKALVALARLDDRKSIPLIEQIIEQSENPRIIIHGALALEIFKHIPSIRVLLKKLLFLSERINPAFHSFVRDEILLAIAGIIGMDDFFYPLFKDFKKQNKEGISGLLMMVDKYKGNHTLVKTIVFFIKKLLSGKRKKSERLQTAQQLCQKTKEYVHSKVFIYLSEVFITESVDDVDTLNDFKAVTDSNELFFLLCTYLVWHIIYEKALENT